MLRWVFLLVAIIFLPFGLLTLVKSPDWAPWKLALLAGEYGHWFALLLVGGLAALPFSRDRIAWKVAIGAMLGIGAALLLKPCAQAWAISRTLPAEFAREFGRPVLNAPAPFSIGGLFARAPAPVPVQTLSFSGALALDFYPAARDRASGSPCVIIVHGGGWDSGDRGQIVALNHALACRGYAVAAISYRLAPRFVWPAQRDDVLAAIVFVKAHARELGIDPGRLVLFGRSAGGQIAEAVAYAAADPAVRGVIALYAPADLEFALSYAHEDDVLKSPMLIRQYLGGPPGPTTREAYRTASGYSLVAARTAPTLLLHGRLDALVWYRQSERLAERLAREHVPHVYVSLPWATHAFEYNLRGPGGQLALWSIEQFLAAVCR